MSDRLEELRRIGNLLPDDPDCQCCGWGVREIERLREFARTLADGEYPEDLKLDAKAALGVNPLSQVSTN